MKIFLLTAVFLFTSLYPKALGQIRPYTVRVLIIQDAPSLSLKISGDYEIEDSETGKIFGRGRNLKTTLTSYKGGILAGEFNLDSARVLFKLGSGEAIINGRRFRGNIQFIRKDNGHLAAVNFIGLEDYIKGVLYHEASHYWPIEALKAQAVSCRAFSVYQMQENYARPYDVTNDVYSQVYGGSTSERYRTSLAVKETEGQVLVYQNKVFPAYYHATCAGHTEDASLLWKTKIPPLKGVGCDYCRDSPHFKWHYVLSKQEIQEILSGAGYKIKNIGNISVLDRDDSGRIGKLRIYYAQQKFLDLAAKDFRNIIGPGIIRSTNFSIDLSGRDAVFEGFGWGHGVGLCQWGAYFMSKQGKDYKEILKFYYPGAEIVLLTEAQARQIRP